MSKNPTFFEVVGLCAFTLGTFLLVGWAGSKVGRQIANRVRRLRKTEQALHDLWGCIGVLEIKDLQPETVEIAKEIHERLYHGGRYGKS